MVDQLSQKALQSQFQIKDFSEIVLDSKHDRSDSLERHQYKTLWTYAVNSILGLWLITSPFLFDYKSPGLVTSDTISGALIMLAEVLSFSPKRYLLRWLTPVVACWLLFAPLVFWSPTPAVYLIDTLVACIVISLSLLVPGTPGQGGVEKPGPDQPPGWSYNPSSWIRRWLGIALALLGFFISRYLATRELGYLPHAWDPFFSTGSTDRVLHSAVSRSFPIPDAGLGSAAYILEVLAGFMGDRARWRTAPWIVVTFAILVLPLGLTSIVLVILQPMMVGSWCGFCLIAAAGLLASVPLAVHEIIAMGQFMVQAKARGKNLWQLFWMGGSIVGAGAEDPERVHYSPVQRWVASVQGVTVPWSIVAQLAIGAWLMVRPDVLPCAGRLADLDHMLGALILTAAAVATAEVTRTARLINIPIGILLVFSAVMWTGGLPLLIASELLSGTILIVASIPKGQIVERYAGWIKYIR